jgi:hypothetical protein
MFFAALIKPSLFASMFKSWATRGKLSLIFFGSYLFLTVTAALIGNMVSPSAYKNSPNQPSVNNAQVAYPNKPSTPEETVVAPKTQEEIQADSDRRLLDKLNEDISVTKAFVIDEKTIGTDILDGIKPTQALFNRWAEDAASGNGSKNSDIVTAAATLKKEASRVQTKMYPILRKAFAEATSKVLWSVDGDMQVSGAGNRTATFISGEYASNRNIIKSLQSGGELLYDLRFTQVRFKWYAQADEFTYFNIKVPADSEVVPWPVGYSDAAFSGK